VRAANALALAGHRDQSLRLKTGELLPHSRRGHADGLFEFFDRRRAIAQKVLKDLSGRARGSLIG
jgi:hypothetical protein